MLLVTRDDSDAESTAPPSPPSNSQSCGRFATALDNQDGETPCSVKNQLWKPCTGDLENDTQCACNTVVFNLFSACKICEGNNTSISWNTYIDENRCPSGVQYKGHPIPLQLSYEGVDVPKWALAPLTPTLTFDIDAALDGTRSHWSTIQILVPVVVGIGVAVLAVTVMICVHRRQKLFPPPRKRAWESAHLHGPRRFLGLLPGTRVVHHRNASDDPTWEIDDEEAAARPDRTRGHLRSTSEAPLLSRGVWPLHRGWERVRDAVGLGRGYRKGVYKSEDYRAVHVLSETPGVRFNIDVSSAATSPQSPLPSVLDIRASTDRGSPARGGSSRGAGRWHHEVVYEAHEEDGEEDDRRALMMQDQASGGQGAGSARPVRDGGYAGVAESAGQGRAVFPPSGAGAGPAMAGPSPLSRGQEPVGVAAPPYLPPLQQLHTSRSAPVFPLQVASPPPRMGGRGQPPWTENEHASTETLLNPVQPQRLPKR